MINLDILEEINSEIVHYFDSYSEDCISSVGNQFKVQINQRILKFKIPCLPFFTKTRLIRRVSRFDKSNAAFNWAKDGVVIVYYKRIYFFDIANQQLNMIGRLIQSRNVLHGGIAVTQRGIFFGEYGSNKQRKPVPIWGSYDDGKSFKIIHRIAKNAIKHVHGIYLDKFTDSLWISTGDFDGECFILEVQDYNFSNIIWHGDGSQQWRAVSLLFTEHEVIWAMDSPNQTPYLQIYNKKNGIIKSGQKFNAPVWYMKSFDGGGAILQTSIEPGETVKSSHATIFYSRDLISWTAVKKFKKDCMPSRIFKFGVISFADGAQNEKSFMISGEALVGFDGKSFKASIG